MAWLAGNESKVLRGEQLLSPLCANMLNGGRRLVAKCEECSRYRKHTAPRRVEDLESAFASDPIQLGTCGRPILKSLRSYIRLGEYTTARMKYQVGTPLTPCGLRHQKATGELPVSPPDIVDIVVQTVASTSLPINRAELSAITTFTPPGCQLRAARQP